jgi:hopene-associated glycosyltransferase HpnB
MLFFLSALSLAAWTYLAAWRAGFWRADERLGEAAAPATWPEVAALIPARNEADVVAETIRAHMATDYPGAFSVTLVDDGSDDGTADVAWNAGRKDRLSVVDAPALPAGWTGKVAAQKAGLEKIDERRPAAKYILFTDADIIHAPGALRRMVARAEAEDLSMLSLMARLDSRGAWAQLLVPAFVYFFQKVYPFPASNDPAEKIAAAAGGCMLVRRDALRAVGDMGAIKGALIDDCALAQAIKLKGPGAPRKTIIALADDEIVSLRDNRKLSSLWSMVERSAFAQLGYSRAALFGSILGMVLVYVVPPVFTLLTPFHRDGMAGAAAAIAWLVMATTYRPTTALYRQGTPAAALLPVAAVFYTLMTASSAIAYARGKGGAWKGRTYAAVRK